MKCNRLLVRRQDFPCFLCKFSCASVCMHGPFKSREVEEFHICFFVAEHKCYTQTHTPQVLKENTRRENKEAP